jgi:hypothetical protein
MQFSIIKDKSEIDRNIKELSNEFKVNYPKNSKIVSYTMPAMTIPFPKLWDKILHSSHKKEFQRIYYYMKSNNSFIKDIIPASEYYRIVFRAISEKLFSLQTSLNNIHKINRELEKSFKYKSTKNPKTNQKSFNVSDKVYLLKREVAVFFFDSRSILDSLSSMFHFLYGTKSNQYGSFSDFIKMCKKDSAKTKFADAEMIEYAKNKLEWFYKLKDTRDYITHYSTIEVSFYELPDGTLKIYLFGRNFFELNDIIKSVVDGIVDFVKFVDENFSKRLS